MMARGSNLPAVGSYNQALILDLIRRAPRGLSRVELAERTGLSAQTLTNVTRRLVAEGLVAEAGKVSQGPGKPRTLLALEPEARFAIGLHLDPSLVTVVAVDLSGRVRARHEFVPQDESSADQIMILRRIVDDVIVGVAERDRVLGIGVAAPGPLDTDAGQLLEPPLLGAWSHVFVRDELSLATGLPVLLEKDVTAAILGEMWVSPSDEVSDAVFIYYGAGVGAGLSIMGSPVRGRTANAGDIAHLIVDPSGPRCSCGARGCLGVALEPTHLLREGGVVEADAGGDGADVRAALDELCRRALQGEHASKSILDLTARRLARAIVEIDNLLDLSLAVVGGPVWARLSPYLGPALEGALTGSNAVATVDRIAFRRSLLGTDVAAVGAACLVLDDAFTARPVDLMIDG